MVAVLLAGVNVWFQTHGTDDVVFRTASFTERLLGAGCVPWFYLYKAIFPVDLYFVYPMWHIRPEICCGGCRWRRHWPLQRCFGCTERLGRPFLFAWGFFCVALVPVAGFTDVGFMRFSLVADHYQHIAIIGVIALAAAGWSIWHKRTEAERAGPRPP